MARPLRIEYPHAFYHVISRGNERKAIFRDFSDYDLFFKTLEEACNYYGAFLHSFCLMPNHIHLLVETPEPNLSLFMKRLLGVYTIRFNRKHTRHGHLFQGRYKAILVDKDTYLLPLSRYIHLNPVKAKLPQGLEYPHSSLRFFLKDKPPPYLQTKFILSLFPSKQKFLEFVEEGLELNHCLPKPFGGIIFGGEEFIKSLKEQISKKPMDNVAYENSLTRQNPSDLDLLIQNEPKSLQIYCLRTLSKLPQKEIGKRFNLTNSAVSKTLKRFEPKLHKSMLLLNRFQEVKEKVSDFKN